VDFANAAPFLSGRMQKEPLCTIQPQTAIGTDTLSRNKVHPKSLKTGHDILLARRQSRHDPRCPTEIHPPYLQQQETRLPQHTENATCHCAVQSTHTQPEPDPAGLQTILTEISRNIAPQAPDNLGVLEHVEPKRCDAIHAPTMQGDRLTAKRPSIIRLHD